MTSDAKLGLLAGMAAVLLIAVVYHRKPQTNAHPPGVTPVPKFTSALPQPAPVSVAPRPSSAATPEFATQSPPADPLLRGPVE